MQLLRWVALVIIAPTMVVLFVVLFLVGDQYGLKDTPALRLSFATTAAASGLLGWFLVRWLPVRHAALSLPGGVGLAMAVWLAVRRPDELSPGVGATTLAIWVAVLTAVSVVAAALASRSTLAASTFAIVGAAVLVVLVPYLAVRLSMGAEIAPWSSIAGWTTAGLTDETFSGDPLRRQATQIALMFALLVMTGTSYVLGYVIALRRSAHARVPVPAALTAI